jgi:hypothetical protein
MTVVNAKEVFVVEYFESERGWGSDSWTREFDTQKEATEAVAHCNQDNPTDHVPGYYIVATYAGAKLVKI